LNDNFAPLRLCERKSGIIFFNKKSGITSFDALRDIKRALGTGKVGHTGTLDKFARGLLIILTGKALKLSQWFTNCDKQYIGKIHFGIETDTLDPEGETVAKADLPSREKVQQVLNQFTGNILQEPPVFSAIHVNGKRASDLTRSGQIPQMKKRPVTIYELKLLNWDPPFAEIFVHCSSGTYIRSLARDIAIAADTRAHLCELTRTQVAGFKLDDSFTHAKAPRRQERKEEEVRNMNEDISLQLINKSVISKLGIKYIEVSQEEVQYILHGKPLDKILNNKTFASLRLCVNSSPNTIAIFCDETLVAIVENKDGKWKYGCVM